MEFIIVIRTGAISRGSFHINYSTFLFQIMFSFAQQLKNLIHCRSRDDSIMYHVVHDRLRNEQFGDNQKPHLFLMTICP